MSVYSPHSVTINVSFSIGQNKLNALLYCSLCKGKYVTKLEINVVDPDKYTEARNYKWTIDDTLVALRTLSRELHIGRAIENKAPR